ncbi:MAG: sulfotransferase [Sandaracinaceae bacterium]|nr:sulfotransferase [Sandaracinaceae bacterium]
MLPSFYCIGAPKAGTTWLYACLAEHPDVFLPEFKEVNWFRGWDGRPSPYAERGLAPYEALFAGARSDQPRGDVSPGLLGAGCAELLHELTPDATIIAILRDPAERAHSQYHMLAGRHRMPFSFDALCADPRREDPHEILLEGFYARHLAPYLERFARVLVLRFEELRRSPAALLRRVCEAIGADPGFEPRALETRVNEASSHVSPAFYELRVRVAEGLARAGLDRTRRAIKRTGLPRLVERITRRPTRNPPLTPEQRARLVAVYAEDVRALAALLPEQDFQGWLAA